MDRDFLSRCLPSKFSASSFPFFRSNFLSFHSHIHHWILNFTSISGSESHVFHECPVPMERVPKLRNFDPTVIFIQITLALVLSIELRSASLRESGSGRHYGLVRFGKE